MSNQVTISPALNTVYFDSKGVIAVGDSMVLKESGPKRSSCALKTAQQMTMKSVMATRRMNPDKTSFLRRAAR